MPGFVLPLLLAVVAFGVGLGNQFVEDDPAAILLHPAVNGTASPWRAFVLTFWGHPLDVPPLSYRPLTTMSFGLDHLLAGPSSLWFHATSLAYYLLLVLVLYRFAGLFMRPRAALLATCLFATTPLHTENVASLVGRADTLALLFSLVALDLALRSSRQPGFLTTAAMALCYLAALLFKESAIALPVILLALIQFTAPAGTRLRRQLPSLVLALVGSAYLVVRLRLIPDTLTSIPLDYMLKGVPPWQRIQFALGLAGRYARLVLAPVDLCTGRKYAVVYVPGALSDVTAIAGIAVLGLLAWVTWLDWKARRSPWSLCALLAWLVFSSLPVQLPEPMADRFMLAPTLFLALAVGVPMTAWAERSRGRALLAALVIVAQTTGSALYARTWHDNLSLFGHAVAACPDSVSDHLRYANMLSAAGQHGEAVWHYAVAAEGRRHFPSEWHHPALEAELSLPVSDRLEQMHRLFGIAAPEDAWRRRFAQFLLSEGHPAEAEIVLQHPADGRLGDVPQP